MKRETGNAAPSAANDETEGHLVIVTIGAIGQKKKRRTTFVTGRLPDTYAAETNAKALGLEITIEAQTVPIWDRDPNEAIEGMIDVAAELYTGKVKGATVDPNAARVNELERELRQMGRDMKAGLAQLVELMGQHLAGGRPANARQMNDAQDRIVEITTADDDDPESPEGREARTIAEEAARRNLPLVGRVERDGRRTGRNVANEQDSPRMQVVGPAAKSEMFAVGIDGEIEDVKLPRVGDTLRSMEWRSDLPPPKQ